MPITENVGGVLKTHAAEYANVGGIIKEQNTVSVNDGGVLREVHAANKVKIEGITLLVTADDHIVITTSGSGTISLPAGARIILGSGGEDTLGGYVAKYTLTEPVVNASFTAVVSAANNRVMNATTLTIGGTTYGCGNTARVIQSKWGPIGGNGGYCNPSGSSDNAIGAGGGFGGRYRKSGGGYSVTRYGVGGGNEGGYGNHGGRGGCFSKYSDNPRDGASGCAGSSTFSWDGIIYAPGGGAGYAAGGGMGAWTIDADDNEYRADNGEPGAGIIVIEL